MRNIHKQWDSLCGQVLRPWRPLRWIALSLSFLMIGCGAGVPKHITWKNATGAEQYERLMWKAICDKDWKAVEYRLASMFVGVNSAGRPLDKAAWIEYWKGAGISDFSLGEVTVQPAGQDMVVTYVLRLTGPEGQPQSPPALRVISVWQGIKGGWLLTATSATPVSE